MGFNYFSPGDLITFHQKESDVRNILRIVYRVESGEVFVNGINGHTFDVNTGQGLGEKTSFIKYVSFEDAVDILMNNPSTVNCGRERVESDLKKRVLAFKVHELQTTTK